MFCLIWEVKRFSLFSFYVIELELYLMQSWSTFCIRPVSFYQPISLESCRHCLAILFSGKLWRWIQNFIMEVSTANFIGSLPSSFLLATFGHCLFTPRNCLQKYICVFSILVFLPSVKIIFIVDTPDFWTVQKNRKKKRIKKFISDIEG